MPDGSPGSGGPECVDLLVVGAGPTGIAIGAEARQAGLSAVLLDRGPLTANLLEFPTFMKFFTTRDRLEIAGVPFAVPEDKPDRRQALTYYRSVAESLDLALALHEEVIGIEPLGEGFRVATQSRGKPGQRRARAVAFATGYFHRPRRLGVPGEELPLVHSRYREPYGHFGESVVVVGGGNSAAEAALDLWRNGVRTALVHRRDRLKPTVKYWLRPDFEHRVEEGSIAAHYHTTVSGFRPEGVEVAGPGGAGFLPADSVYVLIGYEPEVDLLRQSGIRIDPETLEPEFDPVSCESNVPGLYVAGTLQAGGDLGRIFIENSRAHGGLIVRHLSRRLSRRSSGRT